MSDLLYCGTNPVGPAETQRLLAGAHRAIWFPPFSRNATVEQGDRLWLLWHGGSDRIVRLLGAGRIEFTPEGQATWTNRTAPGIRDAARDEGYSGPTNMAFLRLSDVRIDERMPEVAGLGNVAIGMSVASEAQTRALVAILPV